MLAAFPPARGRFQKLERSVPGRFAIAVLLSIGLAAVSRAAMSQPAATSSPQPMAQEKSPATDLPVVERILSPVGSPEDFSQPAPGESKGYRLIRGLQGRPHERHLGLDLSNQEAGGQVRAPADGVVLSTRRYRGWGQLVVIAHRVQEGNWVLSLLAHLQPGSVGVRAGERVVEGQAIGMVGRSGHATGPHLHFELRRLGHVDPWLTLWEKAPVLDPLRLLGKRLADALLPSHGERTPAVPLTRAGSLRRSTPESSRLVGNPEAPLTRREFYDWIFRATGDPLTRRAAWSTMRGRAAGLGLSEVMPSDPAAGSAHISREEAWRAVSLLLSGGRLVALPTAEHISSETLEDRGLASPATAADLSRPWNTGPDLTLTRADGALLLAAARTWSAPENSR